MSKLSQREVYELIRTAFIRDYNGHFKDEYNDQNRLIRRATWVAIHNTVRLWRKQ